MIRSTGPIDSLPFTYLLPLSPIPWAEKSDTDRFCQLIIDIVSAILDGDSAAASPAGNHCNRLTAVTAQREQERIEVFIIGIDPQNDILLTFLCHGQIHNITRFHF